MKMKETKSAKGFSPYVSFILLSSSMIKLFWWFSEPFKTAILLSAYCMFAN
jgi:hypothetical protein